MNIIPQKTEKSNNVDTLLKSFFIYFYMPLYNGTEWIDFGLPTPNVLSHSNRGIFIGWALDGYFNTDKGRDFLNDIIARYLITFPKSERLPYKPQKSTIKDETHLSYGKHKLRSFKGLKSIVRAKKFAETRSEKFHDHTFWAIKFYCEELIISQGIPTYQQMTTFAFNNFEHKEPSTLKIKCRNIFEWYEERDFELPRRRIYKNNSEKYEGTRMTRTENLIKLNQDRAENKKQRVINLTTGKYCDLYKKKNGKWNISSIAKELDMSVNTVKKYLSLV